jgi:hypothetical protein
MPTAARTQHKTTTNTALPYISNSSLTDTDPQFIEGSQNILTSLRNWAERRPGFSKPVETNPTVFKNLQREFVWRRWAGSVPNGGQFFWMGCDISGGFARVYKMQIGVDPSAVLLFTSASAEPFDFVVSNNTVYFGNGTEMKKWDSNTLSNWGIVSPAAGPSVTLVAGTMNVFTSWCYCYTYYNANTDHESSPSDISVCSGVFANMNPQIGVVASTDPQTTNIRIYRTPDGGAQDPALMQELSNSPVSNVTQTVSDTTLDINLSIRVAPEFLMNDPPPPSKGFVAYSGRIWGFQTNTTFYSGFEEISNGVPEECWPSGLGGNFYPWDNEVTGHATLVDGITVFTAARIYKVEGTSLDTFRRYTLLERRGTRSRTTVTSLGGSVAWLDTSNTVWISDLGEVGLPIRPDIQNINPLTCFIAIHISGTFHWLSLLDGANGIIYTYDMDLHQWLTPWTVGTTGSGLFSGETSIGNVQLMFARNNTKALQLGAGTYVDDGNTYSAMINTNMYSLTPDGNPAWKGVLDWTEIKTDKQVPSIVQQLTDDDPAVGTYVDLVPNQEASPDITQGKNLLTTRWTSNNPTAQLVSMKYGWPAVAVNFHLYTVDQSLHQVGE